MGSEAVTVGMVAMAAMVPLVHQKNTISWDSRQKALAAGVTAGTWRDGLYVVAAAVVKTRHGCCRSRTLPRFDAMYRVHQWSRSNASRTRVRSSAVKSSPEMSTLRSRRSNEYGDVCDFTRSSAAFASFSSE